MEALYYAKGGTVKPFNVVPVVFAAEDFDQLEADVNAGSLPDTTGFFFGESDGSETEDDLALIAKAARPRPTGSPSTTRGWER